MGKKKSYTSKVSKMIIWAIQYFGVQARSRARQPKATKGIKAISLSRNVMYLMMTVSHQNLPKSVPNLPARFISTRMYMRKTFRTKICQKVSRICRPDLFSRACIREKHFAPKFAKKGPKFASPIYFHAHGNKY